MNGLQQNKRTLNGLYKISAQDVTIADSLTIENILTLSKIEKKVLYTDENGEVLGITDGSDGYILKTDGNGTYSFIDVHSVIALATLSNDSSTLGGGAYDGTENESWEVLKVPFQISNDGLTLTGTAFDGASAVSNWRMRLAQELVYPEQVLMVRQLKVGLLIRVLHQLGRESIHGVIRRIQNVSSPAQKI